MKYKYPTKSQQLTDEQRKDIIKLIREDAWDHIRKNILNKEQKKLLRRNRGFQKYMCFEMEDYYINAYPESFTF